MRCVLVTLNASKESSSWWFSIGCLARFGIADALIWLSRITAEKSWWLGIPAGRASFDVANAYAITLHVPVRCPGGSVKRRTDRVSRIPAHNAVKLPVAEDCVHGFVIAKRQPPTATEWKLPKRVEVDDVTNIKIRHSITIVLTKRVKNECSAVATASLKPRSIVHRFRQGIVEIETQRFSETLAD